MEGMGMIDNDGRSYGPTGSEIGGAGMPVFPGSHSHIGADEPHGIRFQTPVAQTRRSERTSWESVRQASYVREGNAPRAMNPAAGNVPFMSTSPRTEPLDVHVEASIKGLWTTIREDELMRKIHLDSFSDTDFAPETMLRRLQFLVQNHPERPVFRQLAGAGQGQVREMTFEALGEKVRKCAQVLIETGIRQHDVVCIAGVGSPTWAVSYLGVMSAGAIPCTLYANDAVESHLEAMQRYRATALVTSEERTAAYCVSNLNHLPDLALIIVYEEEGKPAGKMPDKEAAQAQAMGSLAWKGIFRWREIMEKESSPDVRRESERRLSSIRPGSCATIVHTAGTAGQPKAVMLSHDNWSWTAQAVATQLGLREKDDILACLPVAAAAAQLLYLHVPLVAGCTVTFIPVVADKAWEQGYVRTCELVDSSRSPQDVIDVLKRCRPTVLIGAAWMWELIASAVRADIEMAQGATAKKYAWALQQGRDAGKRLQGMGSGKGTETCSKGVAWGVAKRVMFMKIWGNVGLDKCRYASGIGAYCNADAVELLLSVGLPVMWMYGTAECSGVAALSTSSKSHDKLPGFRVAYSGRALKGTALTLRRRPGDSRLSRIHVKGRNVMMGYFGDAALTAAVFDKDGTLRTGDCGEVDWGTQLLRVDAREDDVIRLTDGHEVLANTVEEAMRKELPMVSNVIAVGDGLPFVICLLTFETESSSTSGKSAKEARLAPAAKGALAAIGVSVTTVEEARQDNSLTQKIIHGVQRVNQLNQALDADHSPVKRFFILPEDLRLENGELTPTMELRRSVITEKFCDVIDDIYADSLPEDRKQAMRDKKKLQLQDEALQSKGKLNGIESSVSGTLAHVARDSGATVLGADRAPIDSSVGGAAWYRASFDAENLRDAGLPGVGGGMEGGQMQTWQNLGEIFASPNMSQMSTLSQDKHMSVDYWAKEDERDRQTAWHVQLEEAVLQVNPAISNVMVVGENRPFLSCLISLKTSDGDSGALHKDAIAAAQPFCSAAQTVLHAKDDPHFRSFLVHSIAQVNRQMGRNEFLIRKFIILLIDFLPAIAKLQGPSALTTSMRDSIKRRFAKIIDSIYDGACDSNALVHSTPASNFGGVVGTSLNQTLSPSAFQDWAPDNKDPVETGALANRLSGALHNGDNCDERSRTQDIDGGPGSNGPGRSTILDPYQTQMEQYRPQPSQHGYDVESMSQRDSMIPESLSAMRSIEARGLEAKKTDSNADFLCEASNGVVHASSNSASDVWDEHLGGQAPHRGEELVQLVLDMDMAHVLPQMQAFCSGLHSDMCRALNVHRDQVVVRSVNAGSVVANIALFPGVDDGRTAADLVSLLQKQALDSTSVLRQGAYTRSLISVSRVSTTVAAEKAYPTGQLENPLASCMSYGVGLVLQDDDRDRVIVSRIVPGSPAAMARELCVGDIVVEIDGKAVVGMTGDGIVPYLKGDKGSLVRVAVMRGEIMHTVYMVRGLVHDSVVSARHTQLASRQHSPDRNVPSYSLTPNRPSRTSGVGVQKSSLSNGTPGSVASSSGLAGESHRSLQIINMAFEAIIVLVWRRDGEVLVEQEVSPNGAFPDEGNACGDQWPIPPGRDLCFTVLLGRETASRQSFCLPEFDKRSVRVRIEVNSEKALLSVAPMLRKGKPIQSNIDAYSLRLNALSDTTAVPSLQVLP